MWRYVLSSILVSESKKIKIDIFFFSEKSFLVRKIVRIILGLLDFVCVYDDSVRQMFL